MKLTSDPKVQDIFDNYPDNVRHKMLRLRELVLEVAANIEGLEKLEETLRWGEPSYLAKHGSTLRMDWKPKEPEQVAFYFQCTSRLVPTFRMIYPDAFDFEGKRALVLKLDEDIPEAKVKHCIQLALTYHKIKHMPLLGA